MRESRFLVLGVLLLCCFSWMNCGGQTVDQENIATDGGDTNFQLQLSWTPDPPVLRKDMTFTVRLETSDKAAVKGAEVSLSATTEGAKLDEIRLKEGAEGVYKAEGVKFTKPGKWDLKVTAKSAGASKTETRQFDLSCKGDGTEGASCCGDADCSSQNCKEGVCAAVSCTDGKKNGDEGDVDCGGSVCGKCVVSKSCQKGADCQTGSCESNKCTIAPGGLLGWQGTNGNNVSWGQLSTGLLRPTDLAFHPEKKKELWIVIAGTDSIQVLFDGTKFDGTRKTYKDRSEHFMEDVQGISFGSKDTMGTCGDNRNTYAGLRPPNNFMGPVWWSAKTSDLDKNANDISRGHYDMLHSTPNCMGIAATGDSTYFVFNGYLGTIDWYDFKKPHIPGGDDHSDGVKYRYTDVKVKRLAGVPSNMVYDAQSKWLYVADTGNGRVIRINVESATRGQVLRSFPGDGILYEYKGEKVEEVIKAGGDLKAPSGLALHNGILYVADHKTGMLYAYNLKGEKLNSLDSRLGPDRLGGLTIGPDERVYFIDLSGSVMRVNLRIDN